LSLRKMLVAHKNIQANRVFNYYAISCCLILHQQKMCICIVHLQ